MTQRTNNEIFDALISMSGDVGQLSGGMTSLNESFKQHVLDDKALIARVGAIELTHAQQAGAARVVSLIGAAVGSVIGSVLGYFIGHRG